MRATVAALLLVLAACAAPAPDPRLQPEAAGAAPVAKAPQRFSREAIVAAHPLAAEAGAALLREGGSALDAAIAAQLMLGLVEPQSSGLGGGGFLLHWDGARVQAYDGRETAPAGADERLLLTDDDHPLPFASAAIGGRAVGVPGLLRMLALAHREHGRLPWSRLFDSTIARAEQGFEIGPRLHGLLQGDTALRQDRAARALYYDADGQALPVGHRLRNPEYAAVLRELARDGADALHQGPLAQALVDAVARHPRPGRLARGDLAGYRALEREPLCTVWRRYRVCGMPPPSAGGLVVAQMLALLDRLPADPAAAWSGGRPGIEFLHRHTEAARLAYADRERFVADPDHAPPPAGRWESLLDADYLDARAQRIGPRSMQVAPAGRPGGAAASAAAPADSPELPATTHLSVVDGDGRAVALTSSIEAQFGSRTMVNRGLGLAGGFLLNNQLTDFSFAPRDADGQVAVNRVQPGKRPRSSMAPTMVFERGEHRADAPWRLRLVAGSPGGVPIPNYVALTLWAVLVEGLDAQAAVALPHAASVNGPTLLEAGRFGRATREALEARGHRVRELALTSGSHLLLRDGPGWQVGADPRREGVGAGR